MYTCVSRNTIVEAHQGGHNRQRAGPTPWDIKDTETAGQLLSRSDLEPDPGLAPALD